MRQRDYTYNDYGGFHFDGPAPEYNPTENLLREVSISSIAEASTPTSYIERLGEDSNGDLWIKFFLINHQNNSRGWRIDNRTSKEKVLSAIGKPIVLFRDIFSNKVDHPHWDSKKSSEANYEAQSKYEIGKINKVFYWPDNDSYYATGKITDKDAKEYIKSFKEKKVPLPTSPQIIYDSRKEKPDHYSNWELTHLAIVQKGAYGPDAKVSHFCVGNGETCSKQIENTAVASAPSFTPVITIPPNGKRPRCLA